MSNYIQNVQFHYYKPFSLFTQVANQFLNNELEGFFSPQPATPLLNEEIQKKTVRAFLKSCWDSIKSTSPHGVIREIALLCEDSVLGKWGDAITSKRAVLAHRLRTQSKPVTLEEGIGIELSIRSLKEEDIQQQLIGLLFRKLIHKLYSPFLNQGEVRLSPFSFRAVKEPGSRASFQHRGMIPISSSFYTKLELQWEARALGNVCSALLNMVKENKIVLSKEDSCLSFEQTKSFLSAMELDSFRDYLRDSSFLIQKLKIGYTFSVGNLFYLVENPLNMIPWEVAQCFKGVEIFEVNSKIWKIPDSICQWKELKEISIKQANLKAIPELLLKCPHLEKISFSSNKIPTIPSFLSEFSRLQILELASNKISTIDAVLGCTRLKSLDLDENSIAMIPEGISNLSHLELFSIQENWIAEISPSFFRCPSLESLYLGRNHIGEIPDRFDLLSNLKALGLDGMGLSDIPSSIGTCIRLEELYLGDNKFSAIPETFTRLGSLDRLDLQKNELTKIPTFFTRLSNLGELDMSENPISVDPSPIQGWLDGLDQVYYNLASPVYTLGESQTSLPDSFGE